MNQLKGCVQYILYTTISARSSYGHATMVGRISILCKYFDHGSLTGASIKPPPRPAKHKAAYRCSVRVAKWNINQAASMGRLTNWKQYVKLIQMQIHIQGEFSVTIDHEEESINIIAKRKSRGFIFFYFAIRVYCVNEFVDLVSLSSSCL